MAYGLLLMASGYLAEGLCGSSKPGHKSEPKSTEFKSLFPPEGRRVRPPFCLSGQHSQGGGGAFQTQNTGYDSIFATMNFKNSCPLTGGFRSSWGWCPSGVFRHPWNLFRAQRFNHFFFKLENINQIYQTLQNESKGTVLSRIKYFPYQSLISLGVFSHFFWRFDKNGVVLLIEGFDFVPMH